MKKIHDKVEGVANGPIRKIASPHFRSFHESRCYRAGEREKGMMHVSRYHGISISSRDPLPALSAFHHASLVGLVGPFVTRSRCSVIFPIEQ